MIPDFNTFGELPEGVHWADWDEISLRFGRNNHRKNMLDGLKMVLTQLKIAGCKFVYLDGSFVTNKEFPNDFDACWDVTGVDASILFNNIPELFDFNNGRLNQKMLFYGEFIPYYPNTTGSYSILEFFQYNRNGQKKGIIGIKVDELK